MKRKVLLADRHFDLFYPQEGRTSARRSTWIARRMPVSVGRAWNARLRLRFLVT